MLLAVILAVHVLALPPDDLPRPAYPSLALLAALPPQPWNPAYIDCEGYFTQDTYWTTCRPDARAPGPILMCYWTYLGTPPGLLAEWRAGCDQYGAVGPHTFRCIVDVFFDRYRYVCGRSMLTPMSVGEWDGWVAGG